MPANYVLLERIELNASASSVSFQNIPQSGYTDLKVVVSGRSSRSNSTDTLFMKINNTAGVTSSHRRLYGYASTAGSDSFTQTSGTDIGGITGDTATANTYSSQEIYIPNYTSSFQKAISYDGVSENNSSSGNFLVMEAALWQNTSAVSSLVFQCDVGNLMSGSTFSLYGLAAVGTTPVIAPKASGGNIDNDGTYWYHTFLSTGAFVPQTGLTCDALVVAGGGGGGAYSGGGGGAGGLLGFVSQSFAASTSYTVTIGSGGTGGGNSSGGTGYGSNGTDSQLGALTLVLAGGGGGSSKSGSSRVAQVGGSGGGGTSSFTTGGAGTSGQGFAGGNYASSGGGGGGGSAEAGNTDGVYLGGDGVSTYSSWGLATTTGQNVSGTVYYAGGGDSDSSGAATGGAGGGGAASTNGTTNTGGGGGAWNGSGSAGNGGSGIVIIRYPIA